MRKQNYLFISFLKFNAKFTKEKLAKFDKTFTVSPLDLIGFHYLCNRFYISNEKEIESRFLGIYRWNRTPK